MFSSSDGDEGSSAFQAWEAGERSVEVATELDVPLTVLIVSS